MQPMHWDNLRHFLAVARSGSLSGAARRLRVNPATVLRRIQQLEQELETRLFLREPSGYVRTSAGERLIVNTPLGAGIQCKHCRPSLNYPKGIASRCQPSQQYENWCQLGDNCRLTWS